MYLMMLVRCSRRFRAACACRGRAEWFAAVAAFASSSAFGWAWTCCVVVAAAVVAVAAGASASGSVGGWKPVWTRLYNHYGGLRQVGVACVWTRVRRRFLRLHCRTVIPFLS